MTVDDDTANELRILRQHLESAEQDIAFLKSVVDRITESAVNKVMAIDLKESEEAKYEPSKTYKPGVEFR